MLMMVHASNEFLCDESVIRSRKENGSSSLNGPSVLPGKWKPRSVSAVRDFPPGCGPIVQPVNVVSQEADASSSLVKNNEVDIIGVIDAATSTIQVESSSTDVLKCTEDGRVGLFVEPHKVEMETLANKELTNGDHQAVVKEEASGPVNAVVQVDDVQLLSRAQGTVNGTNVIKGAVPKIKFPRRRVSAVRDFPPYCGLNAADPTEEERIRINGKRSIVAKDEGGGRNVGLTEAMLVGVEESNGTVNNDFLQRTQSDALGNASPMANQEAGATVTFLPLKGPVGDKVGVGGERSMEKMIAGGEESKADVQDGTVQMFEHDAIGVEPNKKLHTITQKDNRAITDQVCRELVVYSRDKALKRKFSDGKDLKGKFEDESVQDDETQEMVAKSNGRLLAPVRKDTKNVSGQLRKVGQEKHLKKRQLDDTNDLGFIGGKMGLVLGLMARSHCPWKSVREDITRANDSTRSSKAKVHASVTPKKSVKHRKAGYGETVVREKPSSSGKVAYTGTLDMVVRDEEDYVVSTEEQREDSPTSQGPYDVDVMLPPFGPKSSSDARNKVREILRLFQAICRKLLQGEEAKTREGDESKSGVPVKRIDLAAKRILKEKGKEYNPGKKTFGSVPGVEVGDEFQYRVELALVGVHGLFQAGIDYIRQGKDLFAVSVVASGGYDNELDNPDCLKYSGSGGIGKDKQVEDQKLERGNLALKNNILHKHPVRVIRGYKGKAAESLDSKSKAVITYIYDGLYTVDRYWQEPGPLGNLVFKFELKRIPGQPELALREVKRSKKFKIREGLCVEDITDGKEVFRICAINTIDNEKPPSFNYITKMIHPDWYRPIPPRGCDCVGRCSDKRCACAFKNGGEIPYNHNGAIVEAKTLVYECGPSCKCPPTCYNRVTQHGMKTQLEIFKTESRGWGVRSLSSISSGSFICEYIGELLEDTEAEKRTGNDEYLFDIGQNYNDCSLNPDTKSSSSQIIDGGGFTIDAANYGNVGRFINHSCSPNLYAQNVLYDEEDKRMPHIMFFAAENIPPLQELTYHYNYAVDTVHDSNGNIKIKNCYCGSSECTGRLY